jgi:hypothetical protein
VKRWRQEVNKKGERAFVVKDFEVLRGPQSQGISENGSVNITVSSDCIAQIMNWEGCGRK